MKKLRYLYLACLLFLLCAHIAQAQGTTISGKISDVSGNNPLVGANVLVKGKVIGTISDTQGNFRLQVNEAPPLTLVISSVGYASQEVNISEQNATLDIRMEEQSMLGQEVVVSASRVEENILESPVTIEKMDILAIQQSPAPDFYANIATLKGVHVNQSSLNFPSLNTRGFGSIANERFVQLVDGMDNAAPLLNFPTGNLSGLSELDVESVELVPGAASALYGPNAFNGILLMNSKNPFEYQGLSAQAKLGLTTSEAQGQAYPLYNVALRYARAFNNKFAFKVNFSMLDAQDWLGNDYSTDRNAYRDSRNPEARIKFPGDPNFDGMNLYGDETEIILPLGAIAGPAAAPYGTLDLRRTGFQEETLIDDFKARNLKADAALHYRLNDNLEAILSYRYGSGSSIYQGGEKYILRGFSQDFLKAELKSSNFFARIYRTSENAGDSYNLTALGAFVNERLAPSASQWVPAYVQSYLLARQGYNPATQQPIPAASEEEAHAIARAVADAPINQAIADNTLENTISAVRNARFQTENGAKLVADSRLYHAEFNYNFNEYVDFMEIQVGGNLRRYNLFSDGTVFNEDPSGEGENERILIDEFGVYTQLSKRLLEDKLKLTGSLRYDKNENFQGQITPRASAVYTLKASHHVRASFQTGFRNPQTQAQFIYFPASSGILLGSTRANAERYGIHEGGAYTESSYQNWLAAGRPVDANGQPTGLQEAYLDYVQPEKLTAYEIGYKGVFSNKLLLDVNYYFTQYRDFLAQQTVRSKAPTTHKGETLPALTAWRPFVNSQEEVTSWGAGLGITYNLPRGYELSGNYSYATYSVDQAEDSDFQAGFNTPRNRFTLSLGNRALTEQLGFNLSYRYQQEFLWESSFGIGIIPEFGVLDAQVSYKLSTLKSLIKIGGTNLLGGTSLGGDYRTNIGAPFVGQQYYVSITFDEFLR